MGGQNTKSQLQPVNQDQWRVVSSQLGSQIVKNFKTDRLAQLYFISKDPKHDTDKQLKIYQYRRHTDSPLVQCLGAQFSKSQNRTVCGNQQNVKVLTQRIPKRLCDMNGITFPQSLYVLSQAFRGFEDLTSKVGAFDVTDKMIGVNTNGQVKVWLNQNFAENHPPFERPILQRTMASPEQLTAITSEQRMIRDLVGLVQSKVQGGRFPQQFSQQIDNSKTFYESYNSLHDYIKNNNIFVPGKLINYDMNPPQNQPNSNRGYNSNSPNFSDKPINSNFQPTLPRVEQFQSQYQVRSGNEDGNSNYYGNMNANTYTNANTNNVNRFTYIPPGNQDRESGIGNGNGYVSSYNSGYTSGYQTGGQGISGTTTPLNTNQNNQFGTSNIRQQIYATNSPDISYTSPVSKYNGINTNISNNINNEILSRNTNVNLVNNNSNSRTIIRSGSGVRGSSPAGPVVPKILTNSRTLLNPITTINSITTVSPIPLTTPNPPNIAYTRPLISPSIAPVPITTTVLTPPVTTINYSHSRNNNSYGVTYFEPANVNRSINTTTTTTVHSGGGYLMGPVGMQGSGAMQGPGSVFSFQSKRTGNFGGRAGTPSKAGISYNFTNPRQY